MQPAAFAVQPLFPTAVARSTPTTSAAAALNPVSASHDRFQRLGRFGQHLQAIAKSRQGAWRRTRLYIPLAQLCRFGYPRRGCPQHLLKTSRSCAPWVSMTQVRICKVVAHRRPHTQAISLHGLAAIGPTDRSALRRVPSRIREVGWTSSRLTRSKR